jgi:hypothetical protein
MDGSREGRQERQGEIKSREGFGDVAIVGAEGGRGLMDEWIDG